MHGFILIRIIVVYVRNVLRHRCCIRHSGKKEINKSENLAEHVRNALLSYYVWLNGKSVSLNHLLFICICVLKMTILYLISIGCKQSTNEI